MNKHAFVGPKVRSFLSTEEAIAALADTIVARLTDGVEKRGRASLVASGGSTPGPLFDALSEHDAPWANVTVTLSDERWVPPTDDRSNEKLLRTRLLRGRAARAKLVPFYGKQATPVEAEGEVDRAIAAMPRPFDVTLLGMGEDGHIASLFPHAPELSLALDMNSEALVRAITPRDLARAGRRMSLTLNALLGSRLVAILIRGEKKMEAYRAAIAGEDVSSMPVRAILRQSATPVEVYWSP